jgi:hypothetical protein
MHFVDFVHTSEGGEAQLPCAKTLALVIPPLRESPSPRCRPLIHLQHHSGPTTNPHDKTNWLSLHLLPIRFHLGRSSGNANFDL